MKKITFFLIFIIYLFLIQKKIYAALWFKYEENPIIPSKNNQFFSENYRNPSVLLEGSKFRMWSEKILSFNNKGVITYLESNDGINWQEVNENAVISPDEGEGYGEKSVYEPTVIKTDKYHIWYTVYDSNDNYKIRHATSNDGINWQKDDNYALLGESSWEDKGVSHPSAIFYNNQYYLWYAGWGKNSDNSWRLGLATSPNGVNWQKHPHNPINLPNNLGHVGGFYIELKNGKFYIYYHTGGAYAEAIYYAVSSDGVNWSCPESSCLILNKTENFESVMIIGPTIVRTDINTFLYYTGYNGSKWQIGLATEKPLLPSPTPTSIPTPTPQPKIILLPGLFASWNKEALLHNKKVNFDQWKLLSFVYEYDGLINTFKNLGFQKNKDFFIFAYDWRQPIEKTVADLNDFIENNQFSKVNLIGHSLGGLIARILTQKYPEKVNQIISVGSPHQGAIQVYKPLSAGEIDRENTFMWLAQKLILVLNKDSFQSDRETIQKKFPIAYDLLPLFDFLKNENGHLIATQSMILKNPTLPKYNFSFPQIYRQFTAVFGNNIDTPEYYLIQPPNALDNLWGNYQDGHPLSLFKNFGDGTVLTKSAYEKNDTDFFVIENFNHREIIYKKTAIKKILETLNIFVDENKIIEGRNTVISPSIIFLIRSPATIEVIDPLDHHYYEDEGIIFIENAPSGSYQLLVKGKEKGNYQVIVGQIAQNNDLWEKIDGSITNNQPEKEIDTYQFTFSSTLATPQFPTPSPNNSPLNFSNQSNQSSDSNIFNNSNNNQSSNQKNPSLSPTTADKTLSLNQSTTQKNSLKASENKTKNNVLGVKTKKDNTPKSGEMFIMFLIVIILVTMTVAGFYKKETISSLIFLFLKKIKTKYRGR